MQTITLFYRDGANYKDAFDVEVEERLTQGINVDDEITMEDLELSVKDIPMVKQYGYDEEHDHSIVTVQAIK